MPYRCVLDGLASDTLIGSAKIIKGGIARKLSAAVLTALLVSFVITAAVSTWIDLRRQVSLETERLTQTARVIASLSADAVRRGDRHGAFVAIRAVSQMPDVHYARLEGADRLLAETGGGARLLTDTLVADPDERPSLWNVINTGSIQVTAPVVSEGETVGAITLFAETPGLRSRVLSTVWATLAGALAAVAAGLAVAMHLARRISRPIVTLAAHVRRLDATGDFSGRIEVEADGEVADLAQGFDTLLHGIRERDAVIAAHVEGLEAEVAERTSELVVARDAAEQANAAKSDFLAVMSHEIRTPLNGILALSEMLAQSDLPPRLNRYAGTISKSGQSLLSIINDILDFSKVEAGKMELESIEMDLAEAAEDVASLFAAKARDKGLDLAVFVDPSLSTVLGDPTRLRQVIGNLANNAIKFTETGGVLISITPVGDEVRIAVSDTGPGIAADRLPTLFDAFTQEDQTTTRKHGGTGLGLAICDRLVRSMDGRWDLSSVIGEGSTFAFIAPLPRVEGWTAPTFPADWSVHVREVSGRTGEALSRYLEALGVACEDVAPSGFAGPEAVASNDTIALCADEDEAAEVLARHPGACAAVRPLRRADLFDLLAQLERGETPRLHETAAAAAARTLYPGARVLVVDDSDVNREVATEALSRLAVTVETAEDGGQAIERLRTRTYDLVLMDGSMPVLDGFEATRRIRAEEAETGRPRVPIVALTAHVVGAAANAWRGCGMDGQIHKPFSLADIAAELARYCADHASTDSAAASPVQAPAPSAAVDSDLFDPNVRAELMGMKAAGRHDFVEKVHKLYAENAPARMADMVAAIGAGDQGAVARAAHALRSMSLSLGAAAVASAAQSLEHAADAAEAKPEAVERLAVLLQTTLAALNDDMAPSTAPLSIGEQLDRAIAQGDIRLAYQPLVDRRGGPAGKAEALVRWLDPVDGMKRPDTFIPALEAAGRIETLTDHVLAMALREMLDRPDMVVSVNASAQEFQQPGFARRVKRALDAAAFPPERLEIEVTETAMLDVAAAARTIDALRALNVSVALDDFGSGFTSLHALKDLRFNTLKIDRSFVITCTQDTASAAILHAVIGVGRALGMTVVSEGVETPEQSDFLRIAGVHLMQGYLFHKPMPFADLPAPEAKAA
jgi:signal transduction histidine kinase/EAL domain-containing protein (putative c-di-GMP-specific phosphodiesterase class I)/CheY-like chemotaxis protein